MVYSGTIATENDIALMAGENVDSTGDTEANHNLLMAQAESYLCALVKYDIVTNWTTIDATNYGALFTEYAARYCAVALISYNMAGYTSRMEAEDMISIHLARMEEIKNILLNEDIQNFMGV